MDKVRFIKVMSELKWPALINIGEIQYVEENQRGCGVHCTSGFIQILGTAEELWKKLQEAHMIW